MNEQSKDYLLEEVKYLREEIRMNLQSLDALVRYSIILSGAFWAWRLTKAEQALPFILDFLPSAVSLLFAFRSLALHHNNIKLGKYVSEVEHEFGLPKNLGWEQDYAKRRKKRQYSFVSYWERAHWAFLVSANLILAIYVCVTLEK